MALSAVMRPWARTVESRLNAGPRPTDEPRAHSTGVAADRILIFGTGIAMGWGVLSHDLAIPGTLARALTRLTGRGTDVDVFAAPEFTAEKAIGDLGGTRLWRYDAVVITLGLLEAVEFASVASWRRHLDELIDYVSSRISHGAVIYVIGVHSITKLTAWDRLVAPLVSRQRLAVNKASAQLCATGNRATYLAFDPPRSNKNDRARTVNDYRDAAGRLAASIAPGLDLSFGMPGSAARRDDRARGRDEESRLEAVGQLDREPSPALARIVEAARSAFGTAYASISVVDRLEQWHLAGLDASVAIPRESSICAVTIRQAGALVTEDATADPRLVSVRPPAGGEPVAFYAGFPIESPSGERIGALCVFDPEPRDVSNLNIALLRDLALRAQSELWRRAEARVPSAVA